jgi:hypothetical protein
MLNRTKRSMQQRCIDLALQTQQLQDRGRTAEALARYEEAVGIARRLAEADPADHRPLEEYAGMLFSLGSLYAGADQDARALATMDECEQIYRDLGDRQVLDARRPLAQVKTRKTVAELGLSLGASAVLDADEAVTLYRELFAETGTDELALALASALIYSSEAMTLYGDPDLTAASADHAMRLYLARMDAPGFSASGLGVAAAIASASHAAAGRLDLALQADEARITAARVETGAAGTASGRRSLATALAMRGLHLQATGDPGRQQEAAASLTESESLDAAEAREAALFWERQQAEGSEVTLAQALETAARELGRDHVPDDLAAVLTRPAAEGILLSPSDRCRPELAAGYASTLVGVAIGLLPAAPEEGLRAGLEAHYLFAIGSRARPPEAGGFAEWGVPWARLLLELCRVLAAAKDPPWSFALALDLVECHLWIVDKLLPLAREAAGTPAPPPGRGEPGLGDLLRDCLDHDAELLTRNNDHEVAQKLRDLAATIPA